VIPVPHVALSPTLVARSVALFPLVGALLGTLLGGSALWFDRWLPARPLAALIIATAAMITGGLHLDGLMDTADGLAGRSAEQRLAIMRDSHVGAYGIIVAGVVVLGQFACLSELSGRDRLVAIVVAFTLSRWAMLVALTVFPAATRSGLGVVFQSGAGKASGIAGTLLMLPCVLIAGLIGVVALGVAIVVVLGSGVMLTRRLGGLTGDTYGAIAVLTETAALFVAVAVTPA
jgi:adenosylcobinamide-GDP ribazoletransferase